MGLLHVCQISAAGCTPFRRYGRTCVTTPSQKAVFCTFPRVTNSTASSALIYTRGAAIRRPQDTTVADGQILPYRFWICRTAGELLPPKHSNFNAEVRFRRHLVTASTTISSLLSEIIVDNSPDNRSAEYELPGLITASTAGTQTWLATQYWHLSRC